jgi:uncharacterized membrane protein YphA (DoxX/SURF4 family)
MAYTHARLRNTLALVRIGTGLLFVSLGYSKVSNIEFARTDFTQFLWSAMHGGAPDFYARLLESYVWPYATKFAVGMGFLELFIGVGLVLGLTIRPVCIVGMTYMLNLMLATWNQSSLGEPLFSFPDEQMRYALPFCIFLLLGIGHAGENWGLGTLYHRRRHKKWEKQWRINMVPGLPPTEQPKASEKSFDA